MTFLLKGFLNFVLWGKYLVKRSSEFMLHSKNLISLLASFSLRMCCVQVAPPSLGIKPLCWLSTLVAHCL